MILVVDVGESDHPGMRDIRDALLQQQDRIIMYTNTPPTFRPEDVIADLSNYIQTTPIVPPRRICGCCGSKGKCNEYNGHKGKHETISGFRW